MMYRQRGSSTIPAVLLAAFAGLVTAVLLADWMVVDVRTADADPMHFKVPFPLVVADVAAALMPADVLDEVEIPPEVKEQREVVLAALQSFLDIPDATLVKVEEGETRVVIAKQGDQLEISVTDEDVVVHCAVPVDGVLEALEDWDWQSMDPGLILTILHEAGNGNLLTVEADGVRVAVNMW